ncbi:bifunctional biotin--[acetyl-CoA-carboxylase] ligase/biotin operon repressor BirA [Alginatibacterium sediminis]|uniref:Bifunctional ligase/repressor BirA n=1 Tax=Alginatibacterium sediminis TaxID=2164068 RepID=A0A420EL13_9ALTE|nr:bifunctional biotin--[acetyl-CoA-carboxylase] ligase/biotin operon repressor BirA [Alginatibacterium sediminis]RKF21402.1 bifunctional biotin--[acetyl-CoA-carboxylase] ligase/biotin operon repressor BirA [Alginatibacterium sediminis]
MQSDMAFKLVRHLNQGQFVSGEALALELGISRTTIANYIHDLEQTGLEIFKVKGKGYRLATPLSLLEESRISAEIAPHPLKLFHSIDSTNAWLMANKDACPPGQIVVAEHQSAGRGRRGRNWLTPYASQLCLSLLWQIDDGIEAAMGLSLVVGIACAQALRDQGYNDVGLKWPNDIYANGEKLGGILVEMVGQADGRLQLIIGVGINVQLPLSAYSQIDQKICDLQSLKTETVDRNACLIAIVNQVHNQLSLFLAQGFSPFAKVWPEFDCFASLPVYLQFSNGKKKSGYAHGIDQQGNFLLNEAGQINAYLAGEVSLRSQ